MDHLLKGQPVHAATGGRPFEAGRPVIAFIHGAGMDHIVWKLQARYFAWHGASVLALDLPAHGRSAGQPLETIEAIADWLWALLDSLGIANPALVGHSMGSLIALEAAAKRPDRVRALGLLGCAAPMRVAPVLLESAARNEHLACDLINVWGHGRAAQLGGHRVPGLWMMQGGLRLLERSQPGVLGADLAACNAYAGGPAAAERIRCPTLFVVGARDLMTPPKLVAGLAARVAGAQSITLAESGHMIMDEAPDATLDALRRILEP
jgi:pimeloyl-ACP methyl ester carboxylesterase